MRKHSKKTPKYKIGDTICWKRSGKLQTIKITEIYNNNYGYWHEGFVYIRRIDDIDSWGDALKMTCPNNIWQKLNENT